jgi:hypothetical protein
MLICVALGAAGGMLLALRFQILVLVPALMLIGTGIATIGMAHGESLRTILLAEIGTIASIQIGYLVGCALQVALLATTHHHPVHSEFARH